MSGTDKGNRKITQQIRIRRLQVTENMAHRKEGAAAPNQRQGQDSDTYI